MKFGWIGIFKIIKLDDEASEIVGIILNIFSGAAIIISLCVGFNHANNPKHCRVQNILETVFTLPYAIGCNLGKDRWDLKVNP